MLIDWLASDEVFFGLLGLGALAFIWNGARRNSWETVWEERWQKSRPIPESLIFYGATELRTFAGAAREVHFRDVSGLEFYANKILRGCDLAYAVALAILTAYVWFRIALVHAPAAQQSWWSSTMVWLAPYSGAMAIAYGVADIAEDLKLASILLPRGADADKPLEIDRAEAAAANMLTVIKMLTLLLSVIGFILFLLLRGIQSTTKFLTGTAAVAMTAYLERLFRLFRRAQDAPAGSPSPAD